jgi:WD40 repeat protein
MITAGRDKSVRTTNLSTQETYNTLVGYSDIVTAVGMTEDQSYLFASDIKGNDIFLYHTDSWEKLCKLPSDIDFEVHNLIVS